jgi:hypothetical protein
MSKLIIGITGFIGSGKDTVASYLEDVHGFRRDSFANTLKDAVAAIFGWNRELLEGRTNEAREWREQVDPWWAKRLGMPHLTPRIVLQQWGTEVCRKSFHDDIWIAALENKLRLTTGNSVISDVRFPNEIKAIKNAGGIVIWVNRGELPAWYHLAVNANNGAPIAQEMLVELGVHVSETAWVGTTFDQVIDNNDTTDHLYQQINTLISEFNSPVRDPRVSTANLTV